MKKVILIILIFAVVGGCKDFLDEPPISDLSADQFWQTPEDALVGVNGMYDALQDTFRDNFFDWGEGRSDNFTAGGTGQFQVDIAVGNLSSTIAAANWSNLFKTIGIANTAIANLPNIRDLDERTRNNYLAQAYAMRAYCYYWGIRVWGDLPVWTEPYTNLKEDPKRGRTSASEILSNVIIPDLDQAYALVDRAIAGPIWNINVGSILAMKTDILMWMKDYQGVLDVSQLLMGLNRYALDSSSVDLTKPGSTKAAKRAENISKWKKLFTDPTAIGTKEPIWSLSWNYLQDGRNGIGSRTGSSGQTSQFEIDDPLQSLFEADAITRRDIRRGQTYDTLKVTSNVDAIWKYYVAVGGAIQYQNVNQVEAKLPLYRFAEILLFRAEAYNKLGNRTEALKLLNYIRTRADLPKVLASAVPDELSMETAILKERQQEFVVEGRRWFDLVRTGRFFSVMDPVLKIRQQQRGLTVTGFGDPARVLFPLHQDVLNGNSLLTQNPGYN